MSAPPTMPHAQSGDAVLADLASARHGLTPTIAAQRLQAWGPNVLPRQPPPALFAIVLRQFHDPMIAILLCAAAIAAALGDWTDVWFILAVIAVDLVIGVTQEHSAERTAHALAGLIRMRVRVERAGDTHEIDAEELVIGDVVLLEAGDRVPADVRFLSTTDCEVDESLLTGESLAVVKRADVVCAAEVALAERINMGFSGTLITRGRAVGLVVATGTATEVGRIALVLARPRLVKPPLVVRMEQFTLRAAGLVAVAIAIMIAIALARGSGFADILLAALALAVSAIPEGLPIALTIALAISMRAMSRRHVIVRRLPAVESLGACTFIASDKTGTLTVNELTVQCLWLPPHDTRPVSGAGMTPTGEIAGQVDDRVKRLCTAAVMANEGFLGRRDGGWVHHGDAVDVALLVMAHKADIVRGELLADSEHIASIPFASERMFAASLDARDGARRVAVKGAVEAILARSAAMLTAAGECALERDIVEQRASELAHAGYRVLALADGDIGRGATFSGNEVGGLTLLGLVGMIDPLRPTAAPSIARCRAAGIEVAMLTGDHPDTALAIARSLDLATNRTQIATGAQVRTAIAEGESALAALVDRARVFARVEPQHKLAIVSALQAAGHVVAVTGDGVNDAPALRMAHVGVAMGASADIAREAADLIVTNDDFSSIVAGVEEGRIAYANIRKVVWLLIATGVAELILFALALAAGLRLPLLPAQILWLNLITNGIQDVALACEPGEGNELERPPRRPQESIFDRAMLERVALAALAMAGVTFWTYCAELAQGNGVAAARNQALFTMVLCENLLVFVARSETRSLFGSSPLANPLLLWGTVAAQLVHVAALFTPGLASVLGVAPIGLNAWFTLLAQASVVVVVLEAFKYWDRTLRS